MTQHEDLRESLEGLDRDKIEAYCRRWRIPVPRDLWPAVHETIARSPMFTEEQAACSRWWLRERWRA